MEFLKNITSNALGNILASFILGLGILGWNFWDYFVLFFEKIKLIIFYKIQISIWFLILLSIVIFKIKFKNKTIYVSQESKAKENTKKNTLTKNEILIIKVLSKMDGRWMKLNDFSHYTNIPNLQTEQAIESLLKKNYLAVNYNAVIGSTYKLSSIGRNYAIKKKFVSKTL